MTTDLSTHPLLASEQEAREFDLSASLLDELRDLAGAEDQLDLRSHQLFEQLRKMLGQDRLTDCLMGIQWLVCHDEPSGARLLAALLDAQTPGAQLLPRVRRFQSIHRMLLLDPELVGDAFLEDWHARLVSHAEICRQRLGDKLVDPTDYTNPTDQPPLPTLRAMLDRLQPAPGCEDLSAEDMQLLAGLVRLESDAYQERVSRLASTIDPFAVMAVMRALPLLNRADAEIRDLGQLALWLESGDLEAVFRRRIPREFDVLEEPERPRLAAAFESDPRLAPLARIHRALVAEPPSVRQIAGPAGRLLTLAHALQKRGLRDTEPSLLEALLVCMEHRRKGVVELELPAELAEVVGQILVTGTSRRAAGVRGFDLHGCRLRVTEPRLGLGDRIWRNDLPTLAEMQSAIEDEVEQVRKKRDPEDMSATAVKQMVINNIGSVSIVLGFLRNAKVTGIPGLVADVARRTRSPRVLEVIANDRTLHSGFANKDVPRTLLESPVNLSVKTLRRFIHVKYVSKTDLRRLAKDKARIRKEVVREIESYLESLS